jgi:hypothetical protein
VVMETTPDPHEQALLLTVDLYETTWERHGIPFGVSSMYPRSRGSTRRNRPRVPRPSLLEHARFALAILRRAEALCPTSIARQLGFYHHGRGCVTDAYSQRESRMVERMRTWLTRANVALRPMPRPRHQRFATNP